MSLCIVQHLHQSYKDPDPAKAEQCKGWRALRKVQQQYEAKAQITPIENCKIW